MCTFSTERCMESTAPEADGAAVEVTWPSTLVPALAAMTPPASRSLESTKVSGLAVPVAQNGLPPCHRFRHMGRAQIEPVLFLQRQDALDVGAHLFEARWTGGCLRAPLRDMESERRAEDAGALPGLQRADRILEFLHHLAGRELAEIPAVALAV